MFYEECPAPPILQPFVTRLWFVRAQPQARYEKILPGPEAHLILNLSDPYRLISPSESSPAGSTEQPKATEVSTGFYAGLQRSYLISENPDQLFNVGARLTPYGLAAFTSQPPSGFQNRVVDAESIFPGFSELRSPLTRAEPEQAFTALSTFLQHLLRPGYRADPRVVKAAEILAREDVEIGVLAAELGISTSTLERIVMRDCGTTAKAYSDVCRFNRIVNQAAALPKGAVPGRDLLHLADYYDQPHLIRSFRRFSGFTPTEYLQVVQSYGAEYATFVPLEQVTG
ncbi:MULTISPECIES: helix-turn-helix domain-containing protein [Micrococcaceae]|uniref:helix-turn-helix domain-containing protein n=1 Tax=Micrococcaceae TaxID=1268 RepID=UPI00027DFC4C|nr:MULTISPECIES: helix-turn-helix domain-containing protein [Micrococcaceae]AFR27051.1 putative transcriptional regulator, AraC family domain protein [Arthrobacter sp. Rue61a]MBP2268117.1 AraC-like DNA-binding protein [Pseudarthrobacter sp. PvP004]